MHCICLLTSKCPIADVIHDQHPEQQNQQSNESKEEARQVICGSMKHSVNIIVKETAQTNLDNVHGAGSTEERSAKKENKKTSCLCYGL